MKTTFTRLAIMLVILLTAALNLNAQVSNYTYTATTGTYTTLSGAGITSTTAVTGGNADDGYLLINLPFPFTYNKIAYTQVTATTNGVVVMGSSTNTNATSSDLFATTAPTNAIAGWWGNLNLNTANSGTFRHGLTATNVYTIQFDQLSGAAGGATSSTLKVRFQISLYGPNSSNPGAVEILFGTATGAIQTARSIGIKSVTSSVVSYKNGVNGSSASTATAATFPVDGTLYRFTPPAVAYQAQFISMNLGSTTWCAGETRNVTVTVKNIGTATWTNASPDINIGLKWNLNGTNWTDYYIRTDANGLVPGATATYTLSVTASNNIGAGYTTPLAAGTNNIIFDIVKEADCWFGDNVGTCGPGNLKFTSDNQTIIGSPTAIAGTAVNTCSNAAAVNITAGSSATNAATTTWTSSGSGTFANANSLTTATYTPSATDIAAGSVTLTLTSTPNSPCIANAISNKTLTINQAPGAVAGTAIVTCSSTGAVNITAGSSASNNVSITWTSNGTGTFANANSLTLATYTPSAADISAGSRTLTLTAVGNAGCANATSSKTITITAAPTAVAGTAVNTCSTTGPVNITAGATSTNNSGITWSSSGTGTFANVNSLTLATYDPSPADIAAGSVTLTLTATPNSPCAANATSNKTLTINQPPTADAGNNILTCSNSGAVSITSGSSATNQASIIWSSSNGTGTFANSTSLTTATYNPSAADIAAGSRTLVLTAVAKPGCSNVTDSKLINITTAPTATAGTAIITCANSGAVSITAGSSASNNSAVTWTSSGSGTFANANSLTLATYNPSAADISAGAVTLTLTAIGNSPCGNATSNKAFTINPIPTTTGVTICQGTASLPLTSSYSCASTAPITAGSNLAGAGANSGSGTAWTSPGNIVSNNNVYATVSGTGAAFSQTLLATGFAFAIPSNATIKGIQVSISRFRSGGFLGEIQDNSVKLIKGGTIIGNNNGATSTNWPTSETIANYGTTTDLWGTTWTATQVNASNFGVSLAVDNTTTFSSRQANVDYIEISVTYTVPGTLNWFTASSGGSSIGSGSSFNPVGVLNSGLPNTNTAGTTVFYAECSTVAGCRTPTNYVITAAPDAPVSGGNQTVCSDGSPTQTLTATATGGTISWYNAASNGVVVTPTQVGVGTSTYYAQAFDGTCNSLTRTAVTLTINPVPVAISGNQTVCSDGTLTQTLTATATGGTITWYDAAVGGNVVTSPTQVGVGSSTYYAEAFDGTCTSLSRAASVLTINPVPDAPVSGGNQTVCENGNPNQTLTATATGGTITWYNAATNGNVVTPTQVGVGTSTYYAEASDGTCSSLTRTAVTLTITAAPAAPTASNQTVCSDGTLTQTLTATATGGTITWFDAATAGNVVTNPEQIGVGTVTYYAESFDGTCNSLTRTAVTLTINPVPAAPISGGDQTICENGNPSQTLTATATGGTITWYDAATNGNVVTPTQVGVGTSTYYAQSSDGTCSSLSRTAVILTINPAPAAPVSGGDQTVCSDGSSTQTLTATATGGTITWYDAATNGSIVTPTQVGVGTSTYYAQAFDGSCNSLTRTAVTLTINAVPSVNGSNQTVCSDGTPTQTLTATATGGTITWYDAATGGNVVGSPTQVGVGSVIYYAESSNGLCPSLTRAGVTLTINPVPAAPVSGGNQTVCENGNPSQTLTATATGGTITWYDAATNGNIVTPTQVGVGTSTYYAESSDGTCSSLTRTAVTLTITAAPAAPTASNQTVCSDGTPTQTLTAIATSGTITWYDAATNGNVVTPTQVGVGTSTYYAESSDGTCSSLTRTAVTLTINPVPDAPVSGGNQTVCSDGTGTQTLTATATGGTITWYDAATNGNVVTPTQVGVGTSTYYAESSDGTCNSLTRTAVTLTINPLPATATVAITQPDCATATGTITVTDPTGEGFMYSIGGTFQSSPVFPGLSANTYNVTVQNSFGCFSAVPASATVNPQPFVPGPAVITGIVNVCPYIGTGDQLTYAVSPVAGATSYNWTVPANVSVVSGAGTANLTVTIGSGFSNAQPNKQIRVTAVSVCGTSAPSIFVIVAQTPNTPGPITGPTDICALIGTANTATYKINKVTAATSYTWTTPAGLSSIVHPNGSGINDTVIVVTFGTSYASGSIKVAAFNDCGSSGAVRSLSIPRTPASTPGLISGSTNACPYMLPGGTAATYSILPIAGATSYNWNTPINSVVTHPNGPGANDYSITVQFPAGFTSGTISVSATNGCGTSGLRSLAINKLNPATPSVIDVIQEQTCPDRVYSYTISAVPANSTQLVWTFPAAGTKISETATSISISYPATAVVGTVTVQSLNNCGSSTTRSTPVKLGACAPEERPAITGKIGVQPITLAAPETMDVKVFPNPTVSDFNLQVITAGKETINVRILDMQGSELKRLTVMPYQTIHIGADLKAGAYMIETRQGKEMKTVKVIKF